MKVPFFKLYCPETGAFIGYKNVLILEWYNY